MEHLEIFTSSGVKVKSPGFSPAVIPKDLHFDIHQPRASYFRNFPCRSEELAVKTRCQWEQCLQLSFHALNRQCWDSTSGSGGGGGFLLRDRWLQLLLELGLRIRQITNPIWKPKCNVTQYCIICQTKAVTITNYHSLQRSAFLNIFCQVALTFTNIT